MYLYQAYGLGIQSELLIPEFIPSSISPDVSIRINREVDPFELLPAGADQSSWGLKVGLEESLVYERETGVFMIRDGRTIEVFPMPNALEAQIRYFLVGTVLSIVLYQQGVLALHSSVVNLSGNAIAFLGVSGQGKSSTAAAFYHQGYDILSDDVAPVRYTEEMPIVAPGFPQIKVSRGVADLLGCDFETLIPLHLKEDKRGFRLPRAFSLDSLPLHRIYTIEDSDELSIEPLRSQEAVIELIKHSRPTTLYHSGGAPHLMQCARLAKACPVYKLKRPRDLTLLPSLIKLVEAHALPNRLMIPA